MYNQGIGIAICTICIPIDIREDRSSSEVGWRETKIEQRRGVGEDAGRVGDETMEER